MNQPPQLLITGASGFTGQHACKHFSELGYDITAVSRGSSFVIYPNVKTYNCDLTDKTDVKLLIQKVKPDFLLHLAGQNNVDDSWKDPIGTLETNLLSTAYIIDAIRSEKPNCKMVIASSALQFDPNNISTLSHPYSLSKTLQVLVAQAWENLYNVHIVVAKPSNLIGPGSSNGICSIFSRKIARMEKNNDKEGIIEINNITTRRDFIDVRDAVKAYDILLNKGKSGEIYEISSGKSRSLGEIFEKFKKITEIDLKIISLSNDAGDQFVESQPLKLYALGWRPIFQIESSLSDTLNYFRNNDRI